MLKRSLAHTVSCLGALLLGCGTNGGGTGGLGGHAGEGGFGGFGGFGGTVIPAMVTETVPQDMAVDVAADTLVQASFNTPLDVATVTMNSFVVRAGDGTPLSGSVAVDVTGLVAIFTPDRPLTLSSPYTATLTTAIKSASGGALDANFGWGFATSDGAWVGAEAIDTGDTDSISPHVAIDPGGNAIAVWSQIEGPRFRVWANRFTQGVGWGNGEIIGDEGAAGAARVAVDPQGSAVAAWDEDDGQNSNIWANRFISSDWAGGDPIEDTNGNAEAVQVGIDAEGNAIALWRQQEGARFDIWANRLVAATGWGDAARIEVNNAGNANFPRLSVAPKGDAMAVWGQFDGTRTNIWANRFSSSKVWGNAVLIERTTGTAVLPDVGLASNESAIAVWTQTNSGRNNIWANRFTRSNLWGDPELIETDDAGDAGDVHVFVDPRGNAHAVWQQSDGSSVTNIWANSFTPAEGWGEAQLVEDDDAGDADSPRIAGDPNGNVIAVWSQSDGNLRNIWANHLTNTGDWGAPQLLESEDAGDAVSPQIALDPGGRAIAIWSYFDGVRSSIWANRFE